jgi:hypothetical protein
MINSAVCANLSMHSSTSIVVNALGVRFNKLNENGNETGEGETD